MAYDVFLSHNTADKPFVRAMADWLEKQGVTFFLDEKDLQPGDRLTERLGKAMDESESAIICLGPNGEGPWQGEEVDSLLNRAIKLSRQKDEFRIIPVLLPKADTSKLRWFLQSRLWVDLSKGVADSEPELLRLQHAIKGSADASPVNEALDFNPYRGLKAFGAKDAAFFFGRAGESRKLAAMLGEWRVACIVGPSGNGKSSLARAGLATEAAEAAWPGIGAWKRLFVVPGGDLLRAILVQLAASLPEAERAAAVDAAVRRAIPDPRQVSAESWAAGLDHELQAHFPDPGEEVLLVVDQFEELFTHRGLGIASEEERQARLRLTLDALAGIAARGSKRWRFAFTLRADFYQRCRVSEEFWKLVSAERHNFQLDELDEEGWRAAIKGPAARAGAYPQAGLVEIMLKDVYRQRGSMPLLQLALHELWRLRQGACLTHAAYVAIGGVANALQTRGETALRRLEQEDPASREIARNLFLRLTSPGEGVGDTRRRVDRSELKWENTDPIAVDHVLAELSGPDNRLIVAGDQSVEVTHEVLIRECATIRGWIELARPEIPILRRLSHAARRWEESERGPDFLNTADPPRELKHWVTRTTLRLTTLERKYWQASRAARVREHLDKRAQRATLRRQSRIRSWLLAGIVAVLASGFLVSLAFFLNARAERSKAQEAAAKAQEAAETAQKARREAEGAREDAEDAVTRSLVRTIGIGQDFSASPEERAGLWELAELPSANENIRKRVLDEWLRTTASLSRALAHHERGLQAAIGLNRSLRAHFTERAGMRAEQWMQELSASPGSDYATRMALANSLAALSVRLEPKAVAACFARFLASEQLCYDQVLRPGCAALAARLDPEEASALASRLLNEMEEVFGGGKAPFPIALHRSWALVHLTACLRAKDAAAIAARGAQMLVTALETSQPTDYDVKELSQTVAALAARLDRDTASALATRAANVLAKRLESQLDMEFYLRWDLGGTLAALAERLDADTAAAVATQGASALVRALESRPGDSGYAVSALEVLPALAVHLRPSDAAALADRLIAALRSPPMSYDGLRMCDIALAALAARMAPDAAAAGRGFSAVTGLLTNQSSRNNIVMIGAALPVLAAQLSPGDARSQAERMLTLLENWKDFSTDLQLDFGAALAALAARLEPEAAGSMARRLARLLQNPRGNNSRTRETLGPAVFACCARLEAAEAGAIAHSLMTVLERRQQVASETLVAPIVAGLCARVSPIDVRSLAERAGKTLLNQHETYPDRLASLVIVLTSLAPRLEAGQARSLMNLLTENMEGSSKDYYPDRMAHLGRALAMLAARLEDSAPAAARGAAALCELLKKKWEVHPSVRASLGEALAALAARMDAPGASRAAARGAAVLLQELTESREAQPRADGLPRPLSAAADPVAGVGLALARLTRHLPAAKRTRLVALATICRAEISPPPGVGAEDSPDRAVVAQTCRMLDAADLAEVLKWPFCVGEARRLVLAALEKKLGRTFGGNPWRLIEQADSLEITGLDCSALDRPAKRPSVKAAIEELGSPSE